jgi:isochorismate pyruvate lyase
VPTPELRALRDEIDAVDRDLMAKLAARFALVDQVIAIKRERRLSARLPDRVEEVVFNARRNAQAVGLPPDVAEKLWRLLIDETIRYEDQRLSQE